MVFCPNKVSAWLDHSKTATAFAPALIVADYSLDNAITKNGTPEVVLISMKRFKGLLETIDILSDEQAMKSLRKSIREANRGKWVEFDEVFGQ